MTLKPAPNYSTELVFHPARDQEHQFFENAAANPFEAHPAGFPRINAWWLAETALLSYWPKTDAIPIFERAGLKAECVEGPSTNGYIAWNDGAVIVGFRGTESDRWEDVLTDLKVVQEPWSGRAGGQVHTGFQSALREVWSDLEPRVRALAEGPANRSVWFCGHSLGAALAILAADLYDGTHGVAAFGSPRVGNPDFARGFDARLADRCARYVNGHDIVTHVPPRLPLAYQHVETRLFIDGEGVVSRGQPALPHFFQDIFGNLEHLREVAVGLARGTLTFAPRALLDHMPKAYAIRTWNDYDEHRGNIP